MLSSQDKELLRDKTLRLLREEGMKVESEEITSALLKRGCEEAPSGRIRIPQGLIDEMTASQKKKQQDDLKDQELLYKCGPDWAHHIIWNKQQEKMLSRMKSEHLTPAFDCGPTTYYDYRAEKAVSVDTECFIEMKKFAQATPDIAFISTWYRQDVPQQTERIESLILGRQYTDKLDGIEAIYPEVIKYLQEISEILTGRPGDASYLAGSECITSPLIIESRSCGDIVERAKCGIKRYHVATMPSIGVSTPVATAGSVVIMAAEVLGGMAACYVMDPEADLSGRVICLGTDMRNANNTAAMPVVLWANLATRELFNTWWGGQTWVEVFFSPCTKRPGLQTVYENFYGLWMYSKLLGRADIPYPGMGTLSNGGLGSPTQFMLDLEIRKSQWACKDAIPVDEENLLFDEICEVVRNDGNFMMSEHTLQHCRDLWTSQLFLTENPEAGAWAGDEKTILDQCDEMWRENVKKWEPPELDKDKLKAMEGVLARAKKEFSID